MWYPARASCVVRASGGQVLAAARRTLTMNLGPGSGAVSLPELTFFVSWLSLQDRFLSGAVLLRVEQHEVAARGAFDPDGEGQRIIVILPEGEIITPEGRPAIEPERGKAPDAEPVCRAADGTSSQAELLKCLGYFGNESLTPSHATLHLPTVRAEAGRRSHGQGGITPGSAGSGPWCHRVGAPLLCLGETIQSVW